MKHRTTTLIGALLACLFALAYFGIKHIGGETQLDFFLLKLLYSLGAVAAFAALQFAIFPSLNAREHIDRALLVSGARQTTHTAIAIGIIIAKSLFLGLVVVSVAIGFPIS